MTTGSAADRIDGGCLCGACRYSSIGAVMNARVCHCHRCQKATGAAFYARVMVPLDGVTITGPVGWFDAGTGVRRGFCTRCGTTLFSERAAINGLGLSAGSLDRPEAFAPTQHIWTSAQQPWLRIADGLPRFEENPPA